MPNPNLPTTQQMVDEIVENGYTTFREWCREKGHPRSSVQDALNWRDETFLVEGDDHYEAVMDALKSNRRPKAERYGEREGIVIYRDIRSGEKGLRYESGEAYEEAEREAQHRIKRYEGDEVTKNEWPVVAPRLNKDHAIEERFGLDEVYSGDEVDEILRAEKNRSKSLQAKVTQLRRALYDQTEVKRDFANLLAESMASKNTDPSPVTRLDPHRGGEDFVVFAPIADPHLGKHVWGAEGWGRDYDTDIACERLVDGATQVAEWVANEPGRCVRLISGDVGDYWHALDGQTESGTLLHQDTRAKKVIDKGMRARVATFEIYKAVADMVEGEFTEGNHDHLWLHMFYLALDMNYRPDPKVKINVGFQRKASFVVGDSGFVLDHGKGMTSLSTPTNKLKARTAVNHSIPLKIRRNLARVFWFCGHLHHEQVVQDEDLTLTRLPAITEPDEYEESLRVATPPGQRAYRINATTGEIESIKRISF